MKTETRYFAKPDIEIRAENDLEAQKAHGYAAVFDANSHDLGGFRERIAKGAFSRSLEEVARGEKSIFALWSHDNAMPLGSTKSGKLKLAEDDRGLTFDLDVKRFNPMMLSALEDSDLQMSFGFKVREDKWTRLEGEHADEYERTLIDVDLLEVSFVTTPAYPQTDAAIRSLADFKDEIRAEDNVDTTEQLKQLMFLRLSILRG